MAKYNYDKALLKGLGIGPFLHEVEEREKHINQASDKLPQSGFNANKLAAKLHPSYQFGIINKITKMGNAVLVEIVPNKKVGTTELAYFRAGQYIAFPFNFEDGSTAIRGYTICSNPKDALGEHSLYRILVERVEGGKVSNYIAENWHEGTELFLSGPLGSFYYQGLRDAHHVVALAGGSGITPFYSMAAAIECGIEDFRLTILYGNKNAKSILLKDELEVLEKRSGGRVRVVHVLSDESKKGYEHGFIDAEIIKKYCGGSDYSIFCCGPEAMYKFENEQIVKLGLPKRRVRFEVPAETIDFSKIEKFPEGNENKIFTATVHARDEVFNVKISGSQTILRELEAAGIQIPADCRAGGCGWCHSRLISGDVFFAREGRRMADDKFGWIHPCCTFATSDIEIEIFPLG